MPSRLPAGWSDHFYEWDGEALNLGVGGCFVVGAPLVIGKILRVELRLPDQTPLVLGATVAHVAGDGMGLCFRLPDTATFARAAEAFERHVVRDPELAARARRFTPSLEPEQHLYPTPRALKGGARTPEEKRALHLVGAGARVRELRARGGPAVGPALLALLERDLLTTSEGRGAREVRAPWLDEAAPPVNREGARPAAAERYFGQARRELAEGNERAAVTSLRLALLLSPGDPQIEAELRRLDPAGG